MGKPQPNRKPEPEVTPQTVAGWHARRRTLLAKLHHDPDGPWAWLWRMHVDIVDYLLHRYAGEPAGMPSAATVVGVQGDAATQIADDTAKEAARAVADLTRPYAAVPTRKPAALNEQDAERLRATQRERLGSLHATNTERRASQPPIPPSLPPRRLTDIFMPPESIYAIYPQATHPLPEHERLMPMPAWLERVMYMPLTRPDRSRVAIPTRQEINAHWCAVLKSLGMIENTTYPDGGYGEEGGAEAAGIDPFDDDSLDLLRRAIVEEADETGGEGEALTDEQIMRLLGAEPDTPGQGPAASGSNWR